MSWADERSEIEDLANEDGPPSFCPECETRGELHEIRYYGSDGYLCSHSGCGYAWFCPADIETDMEGL